MFKLLCLLFWAHGVPPCATYESLSINIHCSLGSGCIPICANIYIPEFDSYMKNYKLEFDIGKTRRKADKRYEKARVKLLGSFGSRPYSFISVEFIYHVIYLFVSCLIPFFHFSSTRCHFIISFLNTIALFLKFVMLSFAGEIAIQNK